MATIKKTTQKKTAEKKAPVETPTVEAPAPIVEAPAVTEPENVTPTAATDVDSATWRKVREAVRDAYGLGESRGTLLERSTLAVVPGIFDLSDLPDGDFVVIPSKPLSQRPFNPAELMALIQGQVA